MAINIPLFLAELSFISHSNPPKTENDVLDLSQEPRNVEFSRILGDEILSLNGVNFFTLKFWSDIVNCI